VPSGGLAGICGVESGKAAPFVGGPPGVELHTVVEGLPSRDVGEMVPIVLPTLGVGIVPNGAAGVIAVDEIVVVDDINVAVLPAMDVETMLVAVDGIATGVAMKEGGGGAGIAGAVGTGTVEPGIVDMNDVAGVAESASIGATVLPVVDVAEVVGVADIVAAADVDGVVPVVPPVADTEVTVIAGVAGAICPDGVEQVTTVPGLVGLEASGSGASVVSGTPD
jgi:hypothetical protein